jgi:hypothetical protein
VARWVVSTTWKRVVRSFKLALSSQRKTLVIKCGVMWCHGAQTQDKQVIVSSALERTVQRAFQLMRLTPTLQ